MAPAAAWQARRLPALAVGFATLVGTQVFAHLEDTTVLLQAQVASRPEASVASADLSLRNEAESVFDENLNQRTAGGQQALLRNERAFSARVQMADGQVHVSHEISTLDHETVEGLSGCAEALVVKRRLHELSSANPSAKRQVLVNYGDVQYVTHLRMGQQTIAGILDTGSFELVVFSKTCRSCGSAAKYDPKISSDHLQGKLMTMQSYGSGDTYSTQAYDLLAIGPYSETNQSFWEVVAARMPVLSTSAFEAIIGIGPPETPACDAWQDAQDAIKNVSVIYTEGRKPTPADLKTAKESVNAALEVSRSPTMIDNFNVGSFSLCLGAEPGSDGYLVWNDSSAFDQPNLFKRVPVVGKHTWSVSLTNVELIPNKDASVVSSFPSHTGPFACEEGCAALLDSGTSLLAVPGHVISWLSQELNRLSPDCSNLDALPDLVLTLGEHRFVLPPDAYVAEVKGNVPQYLENFVRVANVNVKANTTERGDCQLLLMESFAESQHGPFWILGMPFFRRYYTTFFVGESTDSRALYIAPSDGDCEPTDKPKAPRALARTYRRRIDPNKVHVPNVVQKAHWQRSIAL